MTREVRRFASLAALSTAAADECETLLKRALDARGRAFIALSGGDTPRSLYIELAKRSIDWSHIEIFWSDERAAPPESDASNFRMAKETLLDKLSDPQIHRAPGDAPNLEAAAQAYTQDIANTVPDGRFDLVLLGLGVDGHTASLFPDTAALKVTTRAAVVNHVAKLAAARLTFTLPLINSAANVFFLVAGQDKAPALRAVIEGGARHLPAQHVDAERVLFFVDDAAATELRP